MGRHFPYECDEFTLPDGSKVPYSLMERGGVQYVMFPAPPDPNDPDAPTKYVRRSTGVTYKSDAHTAAAKIVNEVYRPALPPDPRRATWDDVTSCIAGLPRRAITRKTYCNAVNQLRRTLPGLRSPADVTPERAAEFSRLYLTQPYRRGGGELRKRNELTVNVTLVALQSVWKHLMRNSLAASNPWTHAPRPTVPRRLPTVPDEDAVQHLMQWLADRYKGWEMPALFVRVKMLTGRRLHDLCGLRSEQLRGNLLVIPPDLDKCHRELAFPLPADLTAALDRVKGPAFLWERYPEGLRMVRPNVTTTRFTTRAFYNFVTNMFEAYRLAGGKVRSHDLRRRAITLVALGTQNLDQTAYAFGISPGTARRHYLDASKAFDGQAVLRQMAGVLDSCPLSFPKPAAGCADPSKT